jgi:hypothetical protein
MLYTQRGIDLLQPEPELGTFDRSLLDMFDDTLAAIHRISKGTRDPPHWYYLLKSSRQGQSHHRSTRCSCLARNKRRPV